MNTQTCSRIFMLSPKDFAPGVCAVCGQSAMLMYRDASTGFRVGQCCRRDLVSSENVLKSAFDAGLRHPTPEEASNQKLNH